MEIRKIEPMSNTKTYRKCATCETWYLAKARKCHYCAEQNKRAEQAKYLYRLQALQISGRKTPNGYIRFDLKQEIKAIKRKLK